MIIRKSIPQPRQGRLKNSQAGLTLLEVLVAMFVLAVGVLALLATQLRSVAAVREAEGQTIVSQITQNLIEGMLLNPDLSAQTNNSGSAQLTTGWTSKSYDAYLQTGKKADTCADDFAADMTKGSLANAQRCQFEKDLKNALPEADIYYTVCKDDSGEAPTLSGSNFNGRCSGNGSTTMIKVAWVGAEKENDNANGPSGSDTVYTFQARVAE
ncbi:type IV pilus modification protein PilV [Neisseria sp.]|uniref:type IV pilus modification protein PilV n=1 Tax=Neisseria sp. TaxID=192066 RepID=UPI00359FE53D